MRALVLLVLAATLSGCSLFTTPAPSPTATASAAATSGAPATTAPATTAPAPTPSPRPNPTAGPGTYVNAGLAYRVDLPVGWRRSACQTTRGDPKVPFVETFTTGTVEEETGTDTGPATDVVIVRVEDAAGLTPLQWLSSGRVGTAAGQRFESTTFDGKDAARVVVIATNTPIAYVVPARGRMYILQRGQRTFDPSSATSANALISSFHALTDAELAGPPFATPTPGPTRTAEDVASAIAKGFGQKDTTVLAAVASPCLTHAMENAGSTFTATARALSDLRASFANGLVVTAQETPFTDQKPDSATIKGTWTDPGKPAKNVSFLIVHVGQTWYWDGWVDLLPTR